MIMHNVPAIKRIGLSDSSLFHPVITIPITTQTVPVTTEDLTKITTDAINKLSSIIRIQNELTMLKGRHYGLSMSSFLYQRTPADDAQVWSDPMIKPTYDLWQTSLKKVLDYLAGIIAGYNKILNETVPALVAELIKNPANLTTENMALLDSQFNTQVPPFDFTDVDTATKNVNAIRGQLMELVNKYYMIVDAVKGSAGRFVKITTATQQAQNNSMGNTTADSAVATASQSTNTTAPVTTDTAKKSNPLPYIIMGAGLLKILFFS